jgi:hypothetical protein
MPRMNGKGPENNGAQTGRKLGTCADNQQHDVSLFGKGMGKRKNSGGGLGLGKRLKYDSNK